MSENTTATKPADEAPHTSPTAVDGARKVNPYLIPGAIVAAGLFIALAVIVTGGAQGSRDVASGPRLIQPELVPVSASDHVRGAEGVANPREADVFLIEYSDYQCPFCARFHATIINELKKYNGKVAWIYRHFPLESIHPQARPTAVASECVAGLAGEDAFWKFTDQVFENQTKLSADWLESTAISLGVDKSAFEQCIASGKYDSLIDGQATNAQEMGGQGTPYNVLLTKDGGMIPFSGAQPEENVTQLIERALKTLK